MESVSAFTTYGDGLLRQLSNEVTIRCEDKDLHVKAVWDTGATSSCISNHVVEELSLIATGKTKIHTPSGEAERNTYLVDLRLPNDVLIKDLVVIDSEIGSQSIGVLIGMDVIGMGDFAVSNFGDKTVFSFRIPSDKRTDYVAELRKSQLIGPTHGKGKKKKRR